MIPGFAPSATVVRPLFFEFPSDSTTYSIDQQFMVGSAILVSPVLKEGEFQVMGVGVGTLGVGVAQGGGGELSKWDRNCTSEAYVAEVGYKV